MKNWKIGEIKCIEYGGFHCKYEVLSLPKTDNCGELYVDVHWIDSAWTSMRLYQWEIPKEYR